MGDRICNNSSKSHTMESPTVIVNNSYNNKWTIQVSITAKWLLVSLYWGIFLRTVISVNMVQIVLEHMWWHKESSQPAVNCQMNGYWQLMLVNDHIGSYKYIQPKNCLKMWTKCLSVIPWLPMLYHHNNGTSH